MKQSLMLLACLLCCCVVPVHAQPERLTLKSQVLNEERIALVRTPPGYATNQQRYPVLYMTDGQAQLAHTISTIEFLVREGKMPDLIVVAIGNTDRTRDLTPTRSRMRRADNGEWINLPASGGADNFLRFIETELIPHIEKQYRTQPYRLFAGHSFGGLFALHTFLSRPALFNSVIAVSPTMQWDEHYVSRRAEMFFKEKRELSRTLIVTLAQESAETEAGFDRFKTIFAKHAPKQLTWDMSLMKDEDHGSVVLRSHYHGLRRTFSDWQMPGAQVTGLPAVEAHYRKLSDKYGYAIQPSEALVNTLGYQLFGAGKQDEALAAFGQNVVWYPQSANVYDSLAEAYEKSGKLALAQPLYEKAAQLGAQNNDPNARVFRENYERVSEALKKGR
ncbi:MAG: alpha/beta hydrolase-fold protein [Blastocatellia bacterium]